jgi:hypothetical protein
MIHVTIHPSSLRVGSVTGIRGAAVGRAVTRGVAVIPEVVEVVEVVPIRRSPAMRQGNTPARRARGIMMNQTGSSIWRGGVVIALQINVTNSQRPRHRRIRHASRPI